MIVRALLRCSGPGVGVLVSLLVGGCPTGPVTDPNQAADPNAGAPAEKSLHEKIFTEIVSDGFQAPSDCLRCHSDAGMDLMQTGHWTWGAVTDTVVGFEGQVIGKDNLINNFCIAVPSNEGRCAQCHPSFGWKNNTPAGFFEEVRNIDCLVCHDTTGTYKKHPSANGGGGPPAMAVDGALTVVSAAELQRVAYDVGKPTRANCGFCHFNAGGGDNVKHGDMGSYLANPTAEVDVHMGRLGFSCQECHQTEKHGISGMMVYNLDEGGASPRCERCHGDTRVHQRSEFLSSALNLHLKRVACETCHLPAFSRSMPTMVEWYWDEAGQDISPIPTDAFGKPTYDKMKGRFVWATSVRPAYRWDNGRWYRKIINLNDTYSEAGTPDDPIMLAEPAATAADPDAKIYPFKRMIGRQPVDPINQRVLVPHLFGSGPGLANAYWAKYDWTLALSDGARYSGQPFSGSYAFANTAMYYRVSHEIPPASEALLCEACHGNPDFWRQLGISDPFDD